MASLLMLYFLWQCGTEILNIVWASPDIDRSHVLHPSHLATVVPVDPGFATLKGKQLGQRALGMLVSLGVTKMTVSEVTMVTRQPE